MKKRENLSPEMAQEIAKVIDTLDTSETGSNGICLKYECKLVTPMFGGGVVAGEVDKAMPVRGTSIRGQLRFWWRLLAMHGPQKLSGKALFNAERDIWGGLGDAETLAASKVQVRVRKVSSLQLDTYKEPAYVLFSANANGKFGSLAKQGLKFELEVRISEKEKNIEFNTVKESIRWWASFGGLGSRTRRGLGAIIVMDTTGVIVPVSDDEVKKIGGELAFAPLQYSESESLKAWNQAVLLLKNFRQGLGVARKASKHSPAGQTYWPEPYAIRDIIGTSSPGHSFDHPAKQWFPRAAFGLPIIFHFKDKNKNDPPDTTLHSCGKERMASPLILRPYWNGDFWRPAALLLPGYKQALMQNVQLSGNVMKRNVWPDKLSEQENVAKNIPPMFDSAKNKNRADDPLQAFLQFFREG